MKRAIVTLIATSFLVMMAFPSFGMAPKQDPVLVSKMVARAEVDECFNGIRGDYKPGPDCASDEIPKTNQSYCWGLTKSGKKLWFGTGSNMVCMTQAYANYTMDREPQPFQNEMWVCEYQKGKYLESEFDFPVPEIFNDYRPPEIYTYDMASGTLTNIADTITNVYAKALLKTTFGLRSAGSIDGLVFLAGPVALGDGINMFVFNAYTGKLIAATTLKDYQNIRKWLTLDGELYTTVSSEEEGGKVLHWTGSITDPFSFEVVGELDGSGTEIVEHKGRIFVGTWPNRQSESPKLAGIWMSPVVPDGGLTSGSANCWKKVWEADDYEPDSLNASLYGCGPLASYGDYLYWGTMHVHTTTALTYRSTYNLNILEMPLVIANALRATAIFRGRDFGSDQKVELLYGNKYLPVYVPVTDSFGYWTYKKNNMGVAGKYGKAGFGNRYNNYTWSMAVYDDQLYVGTMDFSYIMLDMPNLARVYQDGAYLEEDTLMASLPSINADEYGADLWRFPSTNKAAKLVTKQGMGNYANYGFRSVVVDDDYGLFLGTANPTNIYQDGDGNVLGGWELYQVKWQK